MKEILKDNLFQCKILIDFAKYLREIHEISGPLFFFIKKKSIKNN